MPEVRNPAATPYDTVALLHVVLDNGQEGWGSGALIDARHVLTCGHNLLARDESYRAVRITAFPGYSSRQRPNPAHGAAAEHAFYCVPYVSRRDRSWDIGVVRLAAPVARPMYMTPFPVDSDPEQPLTIAGYPGDRHFRMWEDEEPWAGVDVREHVFAYTHDTEAGSSGSPIFQYRPIAQTLRQVGVHSGLAENLADKVGVLITQVTAAVVAAALRINQPLPTFLHPIREPTDD
jgi:V8-like Glu-specific endopeptidase